MEREETILESQLQDLKEEIEQLCQEYNDIIKRYKDLGEKLDVACAELQTIVDKL